MKKKDWKAFFKDGVGGCLLWVIVFSAIGIALFFIVPTLFIKFFELIGSFFF